MTLLTIFKVVSGPRTLVPVDDRLCHPGAEKMGTANVQTAASTRKGLSCIAAVPNQRPLADCNGLGLERMKPMVMQAPLICGGLASLSRLSGTRTSRVHTNLF